MELIPLITRAAKKFDEDKGAETGMEEDNAEKSIGYFLCWFWLVGKNRLSPLVTNLDEDDEEAKAHLLSLKSQFILPPVGGEANTPPTAEALSVLVPVLSRIGETLDTTNKLHAKSQLDREERENNKKNRTKDFHSSFMKMMLMAGSANWEVSADELTELAVSFFNANTAGLVDHSREQH
jgi:hypothetical protein